MEEDEARSWVQESFNVPRETMARLDAFHDLLRAENQRQNLVSASTLHSIWGRHIADSAQLLRWAPSSSASWVDLGSGAGFPGLVVALLHGGPVTLIETRRLRVDFLLQASAVLGINPQIVAGRVERAQLSDQDVISARAFAPLSKLLTVGERLAHKNTLWLLPKGRNAQSELEGLDSSWQGSFRLEPSLTDPEARIIVAEGVGRRGKKR